MSAPGYEKLATCSWNPADQATVDKYTKKKKATDWTKPTLSDLRTRLRAEVIRSQGSACAYCRRKISEEFGLHDLDHILPKGIACYARFTYERMNLVASCKRCNRNKLDIDVLKNGPLAASASYPLGPDDYLWVHPYVHRYSSVSGKPAAYFPQATLFPRMPASTTTVRRAKWNSNGDGDDWVRRSGASC